MAYTEQPAWLLNWESRTQQSAGTITQGQRRAPIKRAKPIASPDPVPIKCGSPRSINQGFSEPCRWKYDKCIRREPVIDIDLNCVVRKVGWHICMHCGHPFWSQDVIKLRLCDRPNGCRYEYY